MIARRITIHGKVQGVFFRDWTVKAARALDISGWVRNRRDGSVEVLAMGGAETLDRFIDQLHRGSPASDVERVEVADTPPEPCEGFRRVASR